MALLFAAGASPNNPSAGPPSTDASSAPTTHPRALKRLRFEWSIPGVTASARSHPVVIGDMVVLAQSNVLVAVDAKTGRERWQQSLSEPNTSLRTIVRAGDLVVTEGYQRSMAPFVVGLEASSGARRFILEDHQLVAPWGDDLLLRTRTSNRLLLVDQSGVVRWTSDVELKPHVDVTVRTFRDAAFIDGYLFTTRVDRATGRSDALAIQRISHRLDDDTYVSAPHGSSVSIVDVANHSVRARRSLGTDSEILSADSLVVEATPTGTRLFDARDLTLRAEVPRRPLADPSSPAFAWALTPAVDARDGVVVRAAAPRSTAWPLLSIIDTRGAPREELVLLQAQPTSLKLLDADAMIICFSIGCHRASTTRLAPSDIERRPHAGVVERAVLDLERARSEPGSLVAKARLKEAGLDAILTALAAGRVSPWAHPKGLAEPTLLTVMNELASELPVNDARRAQVVEAITVEIERSLPTAGDGAVRNMRAGERRNLLKGLGDRLPPPYITRIAAVLARAISSPSPRVRALLRSARLHGEESTKVMGALHPDARDFATDLDSARAFLTIASRDPAARRLLIDALDRAAPGQHCLGYAVEWKREELRDGLLPCELLAPPGAGRSSTIEDKISLIPLDGGVDDIRLPFAMWRESTGWRGPVFVPHPPAMSNVGIGHDASCGSRAVFDMPPNFKEMSKEERRTIICAGVELDTATLARDVDSDGWTDAFEEFVGTNPLLVDSDGDRVPDAIDPAPMCARSSTPTRLALERQEVARAVLPPFGPTMNVLLVRDDAPCVELPTYGGPLFEHRGAEPAPSGRLARAGTSLIELRRIDVKPDISLEELRKNQLGAAAKVEGGEFPPFRDLPSATGPFAVYAVYRTVPDLTLSVLVDVVVLGTLDGRPVVLKRR